MSLKRKYIDSHWFIFALEGAVALLFGWFTLFARVESLITLVPVIGMFLLGFGIIELFNLLRRTHLRETWGLSLAMALIEVATAFALLFTLSQNNVFHLVIISAYTIVRGLLEIALGIHSIDDRTDRFIWVILGICGCVLGFVILNSGDFTESLSFIKVFGAYFSLVGLCNLIYGVHNRDQAKEFSAQRRELAKRSLSKQPDPIKTMKSIKSTPGSKPSVKSTNKSSAKSSVKSAAKSSKKATTARKPAKKSPSKKTTRRKR